MISLLVWLIIVILIASVFFWAISVLPIPAPWNRVLQVLIALIILIWILTYLLPQTRLVHY